MKPSTDPTVPDTALPAPARTAMGQSHFHESARAQVAGAAHYIDDLPEVKGTLYAAPILSTVAHGALNGVDASAALALPGVRGVVLAADVPGDKILAAFGHDEPVFAVDSVQFVGQVIGLVVADSVMQARRAVRAVKLDITPLPAVLTVQDALQAEFSPISDMRASGNYRRTLLGNLLPLFCLESQGGAPASIAQLQATHLESAL